MDGHFDVVIIGAGISGINTAYYLQTQLPGFTYTILEERGDIGGTWDLFKYPGIRSDSDLHTFGFSWSPWREKIAIAKGESIIRYLGENVAKHGIDKHIKFHHRLLSANWSTECRRWNLVVQPGQDNENKRQMEAKFLVLATGYYDYKECLKVDIPGLNTSFKGDVIHPQFWPGNPDFSAKKIVVIGSGATAITLIPNLTDKAESVTMLQRSPSYIMTLPNETGSAWFHRFLPEYMSLALTRLWFLMFPILIYNFCRLFPHRARSMLQGQVVKQLPPGYPVDPDFTPRYDPWDQRLCFTPDGDFFECIRAGKAKVVTDTIRQVREKDIVLDSGRILEADIIITATGLKLGMGLGIDLRVAGDRVHIPDHHAWQSAMLSDVPNFFFIAGYANAPWTLGAEVTAKLICRVCHHMARNNLDTVTPRWPEGNSGRDQPFWTLQSTYVQRGGKHLPKCGDSGPWRARTNYFVDLYRSTYASLAHDLEFGKGGKMKRSNVALNDDKSSLAAVQ